MQVGFIIRIERHVLEGVVTDEASSTRLGGGGFDIILRIATRHGLRTIAVEDNQFACPVVVVVA